MLAAAEVGVGQRGRSRVRLTHPLGGTVDVYAHGAQVLSWRHPSGDVLFGSARTDADQDVHAGIPVLFPQFGKIPVAGAPPLPPHGFARTSEWTIGGRSVDADGNVMVTLTLRPTAQTRALWPHDFRLTLDVVLGASLALCLTVTNAGADPFSFAAGLHTYLRVSDLRGARLEGLAGVRFRDHLAGWKESAERDEPLAITAETDRVYLACPPELLLRDGTRTIRMRNEGFANVVVWNPGPAGDQRYSFAPGESARFVCVEPATVFDAITLGEGESWTGRHVLRCE